MPRGPDAQQSLLNSACFVQLEVEAPYITIMFFIKSILGIMLAGSFGAIVSKQINLGNLPWWVGILSSSLGGLIWGWMASQKQSIIMSSTLYDVTMAITYVLVLILLGETLTLTQFWGIVLAVVGIVLVNQ